MTAATPRPVRLDFDGMPDAAALTARLDAAIPAEGWYDDVRGDPVWRRHVTALLAAEVMAELAGDAP